MGGPNPYLDTHPNTVVVSHSLAAFNLGGAGGEERSGCGRRNSSQPCGNGLNMGAFLEGARWFTGKAKENDSFWGYPHFDTNAYEPLGSNSFGDLLLVKETNTVDGRNTFLTTTFKPWKTMIGGNA